MINGQFYTEDSLQNWFINIGLPKARELIKEFKILNKLFCSFENYENKNIHEINNVVLRLCLPRLKDNRFKPGSIFYLTKLEEALSIFNILSWNRSEFNRLKSRLCSDDYIHSISIFTELIIAKWLVDKLGKDKVNIYPKLTLGGFSDILIKLGSKDVYLEIGNLGESLPEKKIKEILNAAAKYLGEKIRTSCYLRIEVDTAELVFDTQGRIDEKKSIKKIISEIDRLGIHRLAGFDESIILKDLSLIIQNKEIFEKLYELLPPIEKENLELIKKPYIKEWIEEYKDQIRESRLIKSIIGAKSKYHLIEIHPKNVYPSEAAEAEINSLINRIIRHIKDQLRQIELHKPNIIAIQVSNWTFLVRDISDNKIYTRIREFLNQRKERYLSGVILFTEDFEDAIFIPNAYASKVSKLSYEELEQLGINCKKISFLSKNVNVNSQNKK